MAWMGVREAKVDTKERNGASMQNTQPGGHWQGAYKEPVRYEALYIYGM